MNYASSRDVHRCLHQTLGTMFRASGFQRSSSSICSYLKKLDDDLSFAFEVQCNSFGSSDGGSLFCLNAGVGHFIKRSDTWGRLHRILSFVDATTAEHATQLLHGIRASNPKLPCRDLDWQPDGDNWCQYYSVADVAKWGEFLRAKLPDLVHRLLREKQQEHAYFIPILVSTAA